MKKIGFTLSIVIVLVLAGLYALREPITERLAARQVHAQLAATWFKHLPDSLNVILCGAGGPMPDFKRSGPCTLVIAGKHIFVVDVGPGSVRNILRSGVPVGQIEAALLTHYHSDHIGDLGELEMQRWINGTHQQPLPVYGPTGVSEVVAGFNAAYKLDDSYRTAHHGTAVAPPAGAGGIARPFAPPTVGETYTVLTKGDLKITTFSADHGPVKPAVGYRFDYKGRSLVISGDTRPSDNLVHVAKGVDLLVHEAQSPKLLGIVQQQAKAAGRPHLAQIMHDILNYHTTPPQAATQARRAGVRNLLLYHITPPLPLFTLQDIFMQGVRDNFSGKVQLGRDGTWISLPVGSKRIEVGSRRS